jgi:hypothetical protein
MFRAATFAWATLLAAALATAQNAPARGAADEPASSTTDSNTTIRGCLSSSSLGDNHFTLTQDQTGKVFTLSGIAEQLRLHVGHEVEVTGQNISSTGSSSSQTDKEADADKAGVPAPERSEDDKGAGKASDTGDHALEATRVRMLTDHCTASSVGPRSSTPALPVASLHGASLDPEIRLDPRSNQSTRSLDGNPGNSIAILRLVGIVGLCCLVAGFFARR